MMEVVTWQAAKRSEDTVIGKGTTCVVNALLWSRFELSIGDAIKRIPL